MLKCYDKYINLIKILEFVVSGEHISSMEYINIKFLKIP